MLAAAIALGSLGCGALVSGDREHWVVGPADTVMVGLLPLPQRTERLPAQQPPAVCSGATRQGAHVVDGAHRPQHGTARPGAGPRPRARWRSSQRRLRLGAAAHAGTQEHRHRRDRSPGDTSTGRARAAAAVPLNEGRDRSPGDTMEEHTPSPKDEERSTKAGTVVPATRADVTDWTGVSHSRSTKAGTVVPATPQTIHD